MRLCEVLFATNKTALFAATHALATAVVNFKGTFPTYVSRSTEQYLVSCEENCLQSSLLYVPAQLLEVVVSEQVKVTSNSRLPIN